MPGWRRVGSRCERRALRDFDKAPLARDPSIALQCRFELPVGRRRGLELIQHPSCAVSGGLGNGLDQIQLVAKRVADRIVAPSLDSTRQQVSTEVQEPVADEQFEIEQLSAGGLVLDHFEQAIDDSSVVVLGVEAMLVGRGQRRCRIESCLGWPRSVEPQWRPSSVLVELLEGNQSANRFLADAGLFLEEQGIESGREVERQLLSVVSRLAVPGGRRRKGR